MSAVFVGMLFELVEEMLFIYGIGSSSGFKELLEIGPAVSDKEVPRRHGKGSIVLVPKHTGLGFAYRPVT